MLTGWMRGYLQAWESNDPADIGALFTDDALYYTEPSAEPWRGRDAIVEGWLARKDEPGDATFTWQPLVETPDLAVITGNTTYSDDSYSNLWVIRFDSDGRCREFTEWWMRDGRAVPAGP
jgi:ketosteroid isomerase-like protein